MACPRPAKPKNCPCKWHGKRTYIFFASSQVTLYPILPVGFPNCSLEAFVIPSNLPLQGRAMPLIFWAEGEDKNGMDRLATVTAGEKGDVMDFSSSISQGNLMVEN